MRKLIIIIAGLLAAVLAVSAKADVVYIEDGGSHVINNSTYQDSHVYLDWNVVNDPGTHVELVDGGIATSLIAGNNSSIQVSGGTINYNLQSHDNSAVSVSGGTIGAYVHSTDSGSITINGGIFNGSVRSHDSSSTINVKGGAINDELLVYDGTIYIYGSNFSVGEVELSAGEDLRSYGEMGSYGYWIGGTITGTLLDNSSLNADFYFRAEDNGYIIVIPEPASLLLLGFGAVMLRRRNSDF